MIGITEEQLTDLRARATEGMSVKRLTHTLAVEDMAARIAALYAPDEIFRLRAAALLHDLTKEKKADEQIALCRELGLPVTGFDRLAPKTFHARTAAALIPVRFPEFADPVILGAVRWHTTGHKGFALTEKIIYLADFIDESRTFPSCVALRRYFWDADPASMSSREREIHLRNTLIRSFDYVLEELIEERLPIAPDTVEARNELIAEAAGDKTI